MKRATANSQATYYQPYRDISTDSISTTCSLNNYLKFHDGIIRNSQDMEQYNGQSGSENGADIPAYSMRGCHLTTFSSSSNIRVDRLAMARKSHPKKEVEEALRYAEKCGWRVEAGGSHAWGKIYCPHNDIECRCGAFCISSISGTPRDSGTHAKQIRRVIDNCRNRKD